MEEQKTTVVAHSSVEAEYHAMTSASRELIWLKHLLVDLSFVSHTSMLLFCDNQVAMHIASNPVFHESIKHLKVDCHYIRQRVQAKLFQTSYVRTHDQLADVFTKILPSGQFHRLLSKLGSVNPLDPT